MQVIRSARELNSATQNARKKGQSVGFVPTMGALHEGHLSLVNESLQNNDLTVVSIFVNPTQFNDPSDFERYPRTEEKDIEMLKEARADLVFAPSVSDIYPIPDGKIYELGTVAEVLEGAHRPGHFNGVASVVKRLFEIVKPHRAYFGLKDYQQFLVIKTLTERYELEVEVVGCPIVREPSGLARSSRNRLLSAEDRELARHLSESLSLVRENADGKSSDELEELGKSYLDRFKDLKVEYFSVVSAKTLTKTPSLNRNSQRIALLAARIGNVRLIDNMML